ncbi:Rud3p NDAI_0E01450 [Naumovozyma dairenensis CBS 421]|uniref:GRIP domain-containing protein n=1 Tax=Naumovozyma dairenensis (strain ATCC 10597 / BCRC 20456 / CBS 421 / NBRC 0211 / NRRL Y-12639) TaxID=1071378 RepID=G0WB41_NAUDC|nr:hypothetical protein NDAI_0E01450 [Naumovozyma dairenensis CBS 421]CCD24961.1 hypothetical protein NDAI_0E01450 [Naumovozyma dairenensis CBS 421]
MGKNKKKNNNNNNNNNNKKHANPSPKQDPIDDSKEQEQVNKQEQPPKIESTQEPKEPVEESGADDVEKDDKEEPKDTSVMGKEEQEDTKTRENNDIRNSFDSSEKDEQIEKLQTEMADLKKELKDTQEKLAKSSSTSSSPSVDEMEKSEENDKNEELEKLKEERDHFESQYNSLLNRISSMKNVFNKMKESQRDLEIVQDQVAEYESQNLKLKNKVELITKEKTELATTMVTLNKELSSLEDKYEALENKSMKYEKQLKDFKRQEKENSNTYTHQLEGYRKEKELLDTQLQELLIILDNNKQDIVNLKDEKEEMKQALHASENEKTAFEESLQQLSSKLEEQENDYAQSLREKAQEIKALSVQLESSADKNKALQTELQSLKDDIQSLKENSSLKDKLEQETKEQALQIGKLRHESIVLNEHLTKAMAMLKRSSDSESVDKELISNLLISFVSIPRADPKKFEVLELLSSFLNWDDDKKQQAGLLLDPKERRSSTGPVSKTQSFVSMWTDYLEKESER